MKLLDLIKNIDLEKPSLLSIPAIYDNDGNLAISYELREVPHPSGLGDILGSKALLINLNINGGMFQGEYETGVIAWANDKPEFYSFPNRVNPPQPLSHNLDEIKIIHDIMQAIGELNSKFLKEDKSPREQTISFYIDFIASFFAKGDCK